MTHRETQLAGSIDRNRAKAETSARTLQLRELARSTINCAVMEQPGKDRPEFIRAGVQRFREMYAEATDEATAVALFGSLAWSGDLKVSRGVAAARAEQVFATAANDEVAE
jgi:hypothetical protein